MNIDKPIILFVSFLIISLFGISCSSKKIAIPEEHYKQNYIVQLKHGTKGNYIKNKYQMYSLTNMKDINKSNNEWRYSFIVNNLKEQKLYYQLRADEKVILVKVPGKTFPEPKEIMRHGKKVPTMKQ